MLVFFKLTVSDYEQRTGMANEILYPPAGTAAWLIDKDKY
jgi:hypothetical protein